jgi:hypothetical protein
MKLFNSHNLIIVLLLVLLVTILITGCVVCVGTYKMDEKGHLHKAPCGTIGLLVPLLIIGWLLWRKFRK